MPTTPGASDILGITERSDAGNRLREELQASLSVIKGVLEVLDTHRDRLPDPLRDAVPRAVDEAEVMTRMIEDSRVASGDVAIRAEPLDLAAFVPRVVAERQSTILRDHVCTLDVPARRLLVHADRIRLEQILDNLLHNAATYSPPRRKIVVSVTEMGDQIELAVTDEGGGVAPANIEKVFRPYERLDHNQRSRGLGLGLPAARALARAHGGELECRPAPDGPGARFVVTLPVHGPTNDPPGQASAS